VLAKLLITSN